jgi:multisubunit Na+/H+ antiporter MnhC subunit
VRATLFCIGAAYALVFAVSMERIVRGLWRSRHAVGLFLWTLGAGS